MKATPLATVVGGLVGLAGAAMLWNVIHAPRHAAVPTPAAPATPAISTSLPPAPYAGPVALQIPATPPPAPFVPHPKPSPEALADMGNVQLMFRDFRTRMNGNPVGTNAEIMKSVMGGNPFQAVLGPPEGQHLNEQGELVDRWGTPYFFHQLSKDEMEIRSAGPDRKMWTADDVVVK